MASVYKRGRMLWISWYDPITRKPGADTTGLRDTPENYKIAEAMANEMQNKLDEEKEKFEKLNLKRDSIKNAFKQHKENNAFKHEKTLRDYDRFYKKFTETFNENDSCTVITKMSVEKWLNEIKKLPLQPNTIHGYGKQLNNFLNFLFEYSYIPMFRISKNVRTRPQVKEKIIFAREDIDEIFNKLEGYYPDSKNKTNKDKDSAPKDKELLVKNSNFKTMIFLAFYTGLRSSDILSILAEKIDLENRIISYYSPKRKVYRRIAFHSELLTVLKERIKEVKTGPLLDYKSIENMGRAFYRYMKDLKLRSKGYTLRTFRKTFQTLASAYGMDPAVTDELVGYEHQKTSHRYYVRISFERQLKELNKFHKPQKGEVY
jgi:integrase